MKKIEELLREHPFVQNLEEEIVAIISGCAKNVVYQSDGYVFREGDPADRFFLIRHGTVALEMTAPGREPLTFLTVKGGEILGASSLAPPYRCSFDARAVELTRTFAFDARCFREKCEADHSVGYAMLKRFMPPLIERLQTARFQCADLYGGGNR